MELTQRSYLDNQKKKKTHRIKLLKTLSLTPKINSTQLALKTTTKTKAIKKKVMLSEELVIDKVLLLNLAN